MPISTIDQKGLTNPLTSVAANTVASASGSALTLQTNGSTTAVTIDTSQNVGIGTASPTRNLTVYGTNATIAVQNSTTGATSSDGMLIQQSGNDAYLWNLENSFFSFGTNNNERMRIDSSGNILIAGATNPSTSRLSLIPQGTEAASIPIASGQSLANFRFQNAANSTIGYIQWSGSTTTYSTNSDYRLKENIAPMVGALNLVEQLKPVTYNWKVDGSNGQGFIAHELQAVVPDCVTGKKDAVDAEGNPIHQGIDTSFLVATLTAAIQELKAEFDAYKASHP
jgi:hypothetical protein